MSTRERSQTLQGPLFGCGLKVTFGVDSVAVISECPWQEQFGRLAEAEAGIHLSQRSPPFPLLSAHTSPSQIALYKWHLPAPSPPGFCSIRLSTPDSTYVVVYLSFPVEYKLHEARDLVLLAALFLALRTVLNK